MAMRTMILTSPPMHGNDVHALQLALYSNKFQSFGLVTGGIYNVDTAQAVYRAQYWMGYRVPTQKANDQFMRWLIGKDAITPYMRVLRAWRIKHKPTIPLRLKALDVARGLVGKPGSVVEGWYGVSDAWCAMTVCYEYVHAGSKVFKRGGYTAWVPAIVSDAKAGRNHLSVTKNPQPGDLVTYDWSGNKNGAGDHVGIVEKPSPLATIEGNAGPTVKRIDRSGELGLVLAFIHVGA
jgi:hypothetical protein